jgi:hypothetical protein
MRCSSCCALGAESLAQRAAPVFLPSSLARNYNMAALEQLPFESARGGRSGLNRLHRGEIGFRVESGSADQECLSTVVPLVFWPRSRLCPTDKLELRASFILKRLLFGVLLAGGG